MENKEKQIINILENVICKDIIKYIIIPFIKEELFDITLSTTYTQYHIDNCDTTASNMAFKIHEDILRGIRKKVNNDSQ